jgi:hypothetical protein
MHLGVTSLYVKWALYLGVQILPEVNSASDLLGPDYAPAP